jgi:hypothetical protein
MYTTEECFACHEKKREIIDRLGKFLAFPTCPQTTSFHKLCRFVDIGGMETHRCLYFLFIIIFMSWFILEEYSSFALYQFNQILFSVILVIVRELHTPSASPNQQAWIVIVLAHWNNSSQVDMSPLSYIYFVLILHSCWEQSHKRYIMW